MDQINDKPWTRGAGDLTDFFNYAMTEEDWLEYCKQQLAMRGELTEASRQQRAPDPTIVPVKARIPSKQAPKVAVKVSTIVGEDGVSTIQTTTTTIEGDDVEDVIIGPNFVTSTTTTTTITSDDGDDDNNIKNEDDASA